LLEGGRALKKKLLLARTLDAAESRRWGKPVWLTEDEAERTVAHAIVTRHALDEQEPATCCKPKRRAQALRILELSTVLKRWIGRRPREPETLAGSRQGTWSEPHAPADGAARGVIIMGVQGCGKSMCARAIAGEWGLPLGEVRLPRPSTTSTLARRKANSQGNSHVADSCPPCCG